MITIFTEEYTTLWSAISSIVAVIATGLASFALIYSVKTYKKTMQTVHYGEIDKMYFEILKECISKPYLSNGKNDRTEHEKKEYEIFAYILWNFLEAIYDRCEQDNVLKETWVPVLKHEGFNHKDWVLKPENKIKFKDTFLEYMEKNIFNH